MARHSQEPDKKYFICVHCKLGHCYECIDILRMVYTDEMLCRCTKAKHNGELVEAQIKDPETNTVYGPGMTVDELCEVAIDPAKKQAFLDQFAHMLED